MPALSSTTIWHTSSSISAIDSLAPPPPTRAKLAHHGPVRTGRGEDGQGRVDVASVQEHVFPALGSDIAICNCLYGVQMIFNEDNGGRRGAGRSTASSRPNGSTCDPAARLRS